MTDRVEPTAGDGSIELRAAFLRPQGSDLDWRLLRIRAVAFTGNFLPDRWLGIPVVALVIFLATIWQAYRLCARYRHEARNREAQPLTTERVSAVERPPVLYLRSFDDDQEYLAKVFSHIGSFVAIGRPRELLPTTNASRIYVGEANWEAVEDLLVKARLVVIRTGRTTGLG